MGKVNSLALSSRHFLLCAWRGLCYAEDPREDLVDVAQLAFEIEGVLDLASRNALGDALVIQHKLVEVEILLPGAHGVTLHQTIRVFPRDAVLHQVEQKLTAE